MPQEIKTLMQPLYPDATIADTELAQHLNEGWTIIDTSIAQGLSIMRIVTLHRSIPTPPPQPAQAKNLVEVVYAEASPLTPEEQEELNSSPSLLLRGGGKGVGFPDEADRPQPLPHITYGIPPIQRKSALQIKAAQIKERLAAQREADDREVYEAAQAAWQKHYKPFQYSPLFPQGA